MISLTGQYERRASYGGPVARLFSAIAIVAAVGSAHAEIMIVSSDIAVLAPGAEIADTARIEIPVGAVVRIMLPSGKIQTLTGPMSTAVADLIKGEVPSGSILQKAKAILANGGADQSKPGATRAASNRARVQTFSWSIIQPGANGIICVERGAKLVLARTQTGTVGEVTVIDTAANARGTASWTAGASETAWPKEIEPKAGTVYQVATPGEPVRQIKLSLVDRAGTDDANALKSLIEADCRAQAAAWLARR